MAHTVKSVPAMQETQVRSLGQEDPLDKGLVPWRRVAVFLPGEFHGQRIPWQVILHRAANSRT